MLTVGLLAQLTAKDGHEDVVEDLLRARANCWPPRSKPSGGSPSGSIGHASPSSTRSTTRPVARHLGGPIASALMDNADRLLAEPPTISQLLAYLED
jgi:hypothetical protein